MRSLGLLSVAHAVNHAYAVLLPPIFLAIIDEFGVTVSAVAILAAVGAFASGMVQLSYAELTRRVSRRRLLGLGGLVFGGGFAATALATNFVTFAIPNDPRRGSAARRSTRSGTASSPSNSRLPGAGSRSAPTSPAGTSGTVVIAIVGTPMLAVLGWRGVSIVFGVLAILIGISILALIRERGTDRAAAVAGGSSRDALRRVLADRNLRWLFLTSVLGGGGRGLGVVNLFVLIYLTRVLGFDDATSGLMYGALIVFSVPMPLLAGWLSDRWGRKPLIIGAYLGGAIGFGVFIFAGSSLVWLWAGIVLMGLFSFAESPQLQALLADIAPPATRDASYALYFTLAFGVGSLWTAVYGIVIGALGEPIGVPVVFGLMAASFLAAALATLPIRTDDPGARTPAGILPPNEA